MSERPMLRNRRCTIGKQLSRLWLSVQTNRKNVAFRPNVIRMNERKMEELLGRGKARRSSLSISPQMGRSGPIERAFGPVKVAMIDHGATDEALNEFANSDSVGVRMLEPKSKAKTGPYGTRITAQRGISPARESPERVYRIRRVVTNQPVRMFANFRPPTKVLALREVGFKEKAA
uniref:Uncharacterized protein n=1 Tax=Trichuris muris TaxID=70415 RepID=A0A5S6QE83_TRIMR